MRSHSHNGGGTQNQGNTLGDRSCVRQSKLFRQYESGNNVKDILGVSHLAWRTNVKEGAYEGHEVFDHNAAGVTPPFGKPSSYAATGSVSGRSPENLAHMKAKRLHDELAAGEENIMSLARKSHVHFANAKNSNSNSNSSKPSNTHYLRSALKHNGFERVVSSESTPRTRTYMHNERDNDADEAELASLREELRRLDAQDERNPRHMSSSNDRDYDDQRGQQQYANKDYYSRENDGSWDRGYALEDLEVGSSSRLNRLQAQLEELEAAERTLKLKEEIKALQLLGKSLPSVRGATSTVAASYLPPFPIPSQSQLHSPTHGHSKFPSPKEGTRPKEAPFALSATGTPENLFLSETQHQLQRGVARSTASSFSTSPSAEAAKVSRQAEQRRSTRPW